MAAQKGLDLLLAIGNDATALPTADTYVTVAGMRSNSISFNDEAVDVTNKGSGGWRALLAQAGVKSASISGSAVFTDDSSEASVRTVFGGPNHSNFRVTIPDFGTYVGKFMISTLEYAGDYNGEVSWNLSLESDGEVTFATV